MSRFRWAARAAVILREVVEVALALRDPRTPAAARWGLVAVLLYALSPWDLLPEWILGLGLVDDLLVVTLGSAWALRRIPPEIRAQHRAQAERFVAVGRRRLILGLVLLLSLWILIGAGLIFFVRRLVDSQPAS